MNNYDIIFAPIITEKTASMEENRTYVFKVDVRANKTQIKQAIESAFNVKVENVNTMNIHPKTKRVGKYTGKTNRYKKAIVKLAEGNTISFD
ncbi:MAG: 50S ribosomal protein L23 [Erysipelotrichaceae bacterium]|nr:50S ribosomal protein L23 [Erysipelotrichaceae bacterium]